jgi:hypothetical protein
MDGTTLHLLTRLDVIRETQLHHGQLLEETAAAVKAFKAASPSAAKSWSAPFMPMVFAAAQWAGGILALAYIARGGDIGTAMAFLQKLF